MQRLIKTWGKDDVVNIGQRANLYKTIKRLHDAGLIAVHQTERAKQYPERTVYELTDQGRAVGERWLVDMLRTPRNEYPQFPAALSFAMGLTPGVLADLLSERLASITARLEQLDEQLRTYAAEIQRIGLIETEYQRALVDAEATWLRSTIDELAAGTFSWDYEQIATQAANTVTQALAP